MKVKNKFILGTAVVVAMLVIGGSTNVQAALQSVPGAASRIKWTADQFFTSIRDMEKGGGTLGFKANIDTTSYLEVVEEGGTANGVDVHMAKNTEWGTAAMLADSVFGTVPPNSTASTTGNNTGVFQMAHSTSEYVAGICAGVRNTYTNYLVKADARYRNDYQPDIFKRGDATIETEGWKSPSYREFVTSTGNSMIFVRSSSLSIFSYSSSSGGNFNFDRYFACSLGVLCWTLKKH